MAPPVRDQRFAAKIVRCNYEDTIRFGVWYIYYSQIMATRTSADCNTRSFMSKTILARPPQHLFNF